MVTSRRGGGYNKWCFYEVAVAEFGKDNRLLIQKFAILASVSDIPYNCMNVSAYLFSYMVPRFY